MAFYYQCLCRFDYALWLFIIPIKFITFLTGSFLLCNFCFYDICTIDSKVTFTPKRRELFALSR